MVLNLVFAPMYTRESKENVLVLVQDLEKVDDVISAAWSEERSLV